MQIGIDVGATKIESVVLEDSGKEQHRSRTDCPKDYNLILSAIKDINSSLENTFKKKSLSFNSEHPVVRTHPDTGQKSVYINRSHTLSFQNMSVEESEPLINYLCDHMTKPEFTYRFRWAKGSIAVWDNRTTLHHAINDYNHKRRHMQRITIDGDKPC